MASAPENQEGLRVLQSVADVFGHQVNVIRKDVGGAALVKSSDSFPKDTLQGCLASNAVLLGVSEAPRSTATLRIFSKRLLMLRRQLGVFANLRPATSL